MSAIEIAVSGETAELTTEQEQLPVLTSGSVGVYSVDITMDDTWGGLALEAVFVSTSAGYPRVPYIASCIRRTEPISDGTATITEASAAVLRAGNTLYIGVTGADSNGTIVRNSTLTKVGKIVEGADPDAPGDGDVPQTRYAELKKEISDLQTQMLNARTMVSRHTEDINTLSEQIDTLNQGGVVLKDELIANQVNAWLDAHPEALLAAASARAIGRISD